MYLHKLFPFPTKSISLCSDSSWLHAGIYLTRDFNSCSISACSECFFFLFHVRTCLFETSMSFISTRTEVGTVGEASRKTHCPQVACHEAYTSREGFQWCVLLKRLSHCENEQIWVKMCVFFWPFQDKSVTEMCIYDCSYIKLQEC